jgi:hypothetical protein
MSFVLFIAAIAANYAKLLNLAVFMYKKDYFAY